MVDPTRSRIMSAIKGKDTKPEFLVRRALHQRGIRYRLHSKSMPGRPDMVLPRYEAIILVNGCFWHKHNCHLFNPNRSLSPAWSGKIEANVARDRRNLGYYLENGWKVMVVWECAVTGKSRRPLEKLVDSIVSWLKDEQASYSEICGFG